MTVLAHAGHTITTVAYLVPVVGFLGWLGVLALRDRLRQRARSRDDPAARRGSG